MSTSNEHDKIRFAYDAIREMEKQLLKKETTPLIEEFSKDGIKQEHLMELMQIAGKNVHDAADFLVSCDGQENPNYDVRLLLEDLLYNQQIMLSMLISLLQRQLEIKEIFNEE